MKKNILLLFMGLFVTLNAQNIELKVAYIEQEQSNWCSAAVAKCLLDYYGIKINGKNVSQCNIMDYVRTVRPGYGAICCPKPPNNFPYDCNKGVPLGFANEKGSVKDILWRFGNLPCVGLESVQGPAAIENSLNKNLLLIAQWDHHIPPFDGPGAHAVVIHGIIDGDVYYMDPAPISSTEGGLRRLDWYTFQHNANYKWLYTLVLTDCSGRGDYPCHCYNKIFESELGEKGLDCGGPCPKCETTVPWYCYNRKHDKELGETGVDCGGSCPQRCEDLAPCANCIGGDGELMIDCGGDCAPCYDVLEEIVITNTAHLAINWFTGLTSQIRPEIMAFKKITAKDATIFKPEHKISFITEEEGTIILLPGFKAERGSSFTTQRKDLSGSSRMCGEICRIEYTSYDHTVPTGYGFILTMYNLFNAKEIKYSIHTLEGGQQVYEKTLNITSNGNFKLWDLVTGTTNPKGTVWYYIVYEVSYCNGAIYGNTSRFYVNYKSSKSSNEEPDDPDDPETHLSPPPNNITLQDEIPTPTFSIIPNPNPGTFQIETNFSLSDITNLKITNSLGATVYETQSLFSNTIQLPTSTSGLHFVVAVLKDGTVLTQKMMLQR